MSQSTHATGARPHPSSNRVPVLLAIGGHDPSGGAGLQADIEAAAAAGLHCCTAVTCITTQDSRGLTALAPQPPAQVRAQCEAVLADSRISAIKIGLVGSSGLAQTLATLLIEHPQIPVVLDPVLASGAGQSLADAALLNQLRRHLIAHCDLLTPNVPEALALADATDSEIAARQLMTLGCRAVLITGTHAPSDDVVNRLYRPDSPCREWRWPRLPDSYHGSGCTLASAIAARLALGQALDDAVGDAQRYVAATLRHARRTGHGQLTPRRVGLPD